MKSIEFCLQSVCFFILTLRSYALNFFHISDLHFNPNDKNGTQNLEKILKSIAAYKQKDDVLLISGDILNKDFFDYQPIFDKIFSLKMPFLCCTGNHDTSAHLIEALKTFYPKHPLPSNTEKLDYVCDDFPLKIITLDSFKKNAAGGDNCIVFRDRQALEQQKKD